MKRIERNKSKQMFILFLGLHFSFVFLAYGQSYLVHHYKESDGLPSAEVHDITQDRWGRIWFATRAGIAVYDGVSWEKYTVSDGLPVLSYFKIAADRKGRIWALSSSSLKGFFVVHLEGSRWDTVNYQKFNEPKLTSFQLVETVGEPAIAVGTANYGLLLGNRGKWENVTENDGLRSNTINGLAALEGKLYVATNNGLSIIHGNRTIDNGLNDSLDLPSLKIKGICVLSKDKFPDTHIKHSQIWLYGEEWLGYFEEGIFKMRFYPAEISPHREESVIMQPDYRCGVYVGRKYSVNYFNYKTRSWEPIRLTSGLITDGANSLFIDFEKNIWIPGDRGVSKISSRRFGNFQKEHGLLEDEVTAVLEYEPGRFVLGHNQGITLYDGKEFRVVPLSRKGAQISRVLDMQSDTKQNIWLAMAWAGLAKVNLQHRDKPQVTWYDNADGLGDNVICLWIGKKKTDNDKDKVWIGTGEGLFLYNEHQRRFEPVNIGIFPGAGPRRICGSGGKLRYIGTFEDGLYIYSDGEKKWKNYRIPGDPNANNIFAIKEDSRGRLLIGTLAGLFILRDDTLQRFKVKNFQIDRPVFFILEDKKGRFWFGTDYGVVRWDGKKKKEYFTSHGMIGHETNRAAGIEDSKGRIWIGTNRGVSIYNEAFDDSEVFNPAPRLQLLYMDVSGKKIPLNQPVRLSHKDNSIVFHFRGISFSDESALRFKNKLEGFEKEWRDEHYPYEQMIKYTRLPAGTYRFHLKAVNGLGVWSPVVTSAKITILKPFYNRWWFFLLAIMGIGFVLYAISRYLAEKRHSALLEKQVKERNNRLVDVERRYRNLFEESKDVVFIITPEGKFIDINPAGVEFFGFQSKDEFLKTSVEFYNHPEDKSEFRGAIEAEGYVKDHELIFKNKGGKEITGQVTATLERDKEGNITAYRGIIRDITDKKRLEQQLFQAHKLEAIGTLAGGIAHDFNNILGVIVGYTELALEDLQSGTQVHSNIENVLSAAERAAQLVRQILAFSRQSEGKQRPLKASLIVKEVLKLLRASLPATIEIQTDIQVTSDIVMADPAQIHQIIMNLCTNAAQAMQANGGILEVILDEVNIDLGSAKKYHHIKSGAYLRLTVSDTGPGIPGDLAKRIFEPYFTTKKTGKGTGMGLAVIHGIVKNLGGDINIYSEPGRGTTLRVLLPRLEEETVSKAHLAEEAPGGSERILLVDDEVLLLQVVTEMLERLGYKVLAKSGSIQALEAFRNDPDRFDLVITDLTMPHMTGSQLAKEIKKLKPGIPVILCSGFRDIGIKKNADSKKKSRAFGVNDFVTKPIIKNELAKVIRKVLDFGSEEHPRKKC